MIKRFWRALQYNAPCSPRPGSSGGVSYVCFVCPVVFLPLFSSAQFSAVALCLLWAVFCPQQEWGALVGLLSKTWSRYCQAWVSLSRSAECLGGTCTFQKMCLRLF